MSKKTERTSPLRLFRRVFFRKGCVIVVGILLVYVLIGFLLTPYMVKRYVPQLVQNHLQRTARIGDVRANPFSFTLEADNFQLNEMDGRPLAGFEGLIVDFELSSLFRWAWTFKRFELVRPVVNVIVEPNGMVNLATLVPTSAEPVADAESAPPRMVFHNVAIREGEMDIVDQRQSSPATVKISPLNLELNNISTIPEQKGPYALVATTEDGARMEWTGEVFLNPLRSTGNLTFDNVRAATLHEFVSDAVNIDPPEGFLHLKTDYHVDLSGSEPHLTLRETDVRLSGLSLTRKGDAAPFLDIEKTEFIGSHLDLADRILDIRQVLLSGGAVRFAVDEEGTFELSRIIPSSPTGDQAGTMSSETEKAPWKLTVADVKIDGFALDYQDASVVPESIAAIGAINANFNIDAETGAEQVDLLAKNLAVTLENVHAGLADAPEPLIRVDRLVLQEGLFDLQQRALTTSRIGFEGGEIVLERDSAGEVDLFHLIAPPESRTLKRRSEEAESKDEPWQFAAKTIEFSDFKTNISDRVLKPDGNIITIVPLNVTFSDVDGKSPMGFMVDLKIREGGSLAVNGSVDPAGPSAEAEIDIAGVALAPIQPFIDSVANLVLHSGTLSSRGKVIYSHQPAGANLAFDGGFKLARLKITEPNSAETLLGWQSLSSDRLKLTLQPDQLEIQDLRLVEPVAKLVIFEDGSVNLMKVIKAPPRSSVHPGSDATKDKTNSGFPINIKKVRVDKGILDFADLTLTPQFGTKIETLSGVIAGMSSSRNARAQIDLEGVVDRYGQARIGGEINAFDPVGFTDITMVFRNIDMRNMTPYSEKFAGREIDSGKLSLDLEYKIDKGRLLGDHNIIVDRIRLGKKVDSPDATNLPLDLAVALMEDTNGVIDIGLPVKGDLNDLEFSYGHLIGQAIVNLITKMATAPFRFLGAMIPGGSDTIDRVAFEPGESVLPPPEREKIKLLADALQKRPQLALEVQGRYSVERDGAALKDIHVRRLVAAGLGTPSEPGTKPNPVDFGSPETQQVLETLFIERFGVMALDQLKGSLAQDPKTLTGADGQKSQTEKAEDPGELSKAVYSRLVKSDPLDDSVLVGLAVARHQAIIEELKTEGGMVPARLKVKAPAEIPEGEPLGARLYLEAAGKSS